MAALALRLGCKVLQQEAWNLRMVHPTVSLCIKSGNPETVKNVVAPEKKAKVQVNKRTPSSNLPAGIAGEALTNDAVSSRPEKEIAQLSARKTLVQFPLRAPFSAVHETVGVVAAAGEELKEKKTREESSSSSSTSSSSSDSDSSSSSDSEAEENVLQVPVKSKIGFPKQDSCPSEAPDEKEALSQQQKATARLEKHSKDVKQKDSHKITKASASPAAPSVSRPTGSPAAPSISRPTGSPAAASVSRPTGSPAVPSVSRPTGSRAAPSVSRPSGSPAAPSVSRPTGSRAAPSVSRPTGSPAAPSVSRPTGSTPAPSVSRPTGSTPAPNVSRPTKVQRGISEPSLQRKSTMPGIKANEATGGLVPIETKVVKKERKVAVSQKGHGTKEVPPPSSSVISPRTGPGQSSSGNVTQDRPLAGASSLTPEPGAELERSIQREDTFLPPHAAAPEGGDKVPEPSTTTVGAEEASTALDTAMEIGDPSATPETEPIAAALEQPFDNSTYRNLQHHSFTPYTFMDIELELSKFRLPQPSSGRPSPRH